MYIIIIANQNSKRGQSLPYVCKASEADHFFVAIGSILEDANFACLYSYACGYYK